ncbi:MAG: SpoIIE family protein phosphatase, partial [Acidobacteria bacterium]|nr:SpoIIE family protein phosphatase [Acidobacteriota bacterium]
RGRSDPARIEQATVESSLTGEMIDEDLAVARQVQSNLLPRNLKPVPRLEANATVLGAFRHWNAVECALTLNSGDLLAVYSDGVTEAGRGRGAEFGEERLIRLIRRFREQTVPRLVLSIVEEVQIWGGLVPEDDLTVAILRGRTD